MVFHDGTKFPQFIMMLDTWRTSRFGQGARYSASALQEDDIAPNI